jgi:hypothetical protein
MKRGPRLMSPRLRFLKGYGPRSTPSRSPPPATEPEMAAWLASDDCPLNWLAKKAPYEPATSRRKERQASPRRRARQRLDQT